MECYNEIRKMMFKEPKNILFGFKMYAEVKMDVESSVSKTADNVLKDGFISSRDEDFPFFNHIQTTSRLYLTSFPMVVME
jgi:hypothetical protein